MIDRFFVSESWSKHLAISFLITLGIVFCLSQNSFSQTRINKTLVDLKSASIKVQIPAEIERNGLTKKQLEEDAELHLRRIGIFSNTDASSFLYIFIQSVEFDNIIAYSIEVSLNQRVVLEREKTEYLFAPTWTVTTIGIRDKPNIKNIRELISELLDRFVSDYQAAKQWSDALDKLLWGEQSKKSDSPFTATYIGENRPPEVEIFNDSDRTLYLDFGQDTLTPYTIPPKTSKKFTLTEGLYKYKATAPRVVPLAGDVTFQKGYRYTWRFVIVTRRIN